MMSCKLASPRTPTSVVLLGRSKPRSAQEFRGAATLLASVQLVASAAGCHCRIPLYQNSIAHIVTVDNTKRKKLVVPQPDRSSSTTSTSHGAARIPAVAPGCGAERAERPLGSPENQLAPLLLCCTQPTSQCRASVASSYGTQS